MCVAYVIDTMYKTIWCFFPQVILQADKTSNNFSDRAILKNLGHWLGMQTLGKNKPVLQKVCLLISFSYFMRKISYLQLIF